MYNLFKKTLFKNILAFIDFFIEIITPVISSTSIKCGVMCVPHVIQ